MRESASALCSRRRACSRRDALQEAVGIHVREILFSALDRADVAFSFEDQAESSLDTDLVCPQSMGQVILEATRRVFDPALVRRVLGDTRRVLALSPDPLLRSQKITLTPADGFVLSRIDGTLSAREVMDLSPMSEEDTERSLFSLLCTGIVGYRDEVTVRPLATGQTTVPATRRVPPRPLPRPLPSRRRAPRRSGRRRSPHRRSRSRRLARLRRPAPSDQRRSAPSWRRAPSREGIPSRCSESSPPRTRRRSGSPTPVSRESCTPTPFWTRVSPACAGCETPPSCNSVRPSRRSAARDSASYAAEKARARPTSDAAGRRGHAAATRPSPHPTARSRPGRRRYRSRAARDASGQPRGALACGPAAFRGRAVLGRHPGAGAAPAARGGGDADPGSPASRAGLHQEPPVEEEGGERSPSSSCGSARSSPRPTSCWRRSTAQAASSPARERPTRGYWRFSRGTKPPRTASRSSTPRRPSPRRRAGCAGSSGCAEIPPRASRPSQRFPRTCRWSSAT